MYTCFTSELSSTQKNKAFNLPGLQADLFEFKANLVYILRPRVSQHYKVRLFKKEK